MSQVGLSRFRPDFRHCLKLGRFENGTLFRVSEIGTFRFRRSAVSVKIGKNLSPDPFISDLRRTDAKRVQLYSPLSRKTKSGGIHLRFCTSKRRWGHIEVRTQGRNRGGGGERGFRPERKISGDANSHYAPNQQPKTRNWENPLQIMQDKSLRGNNWVFTTFRPNNEAKIGLLSQPNYV